MLEENMFDKQTTANFSINQPDQLQHISMWLHGEELHLRAQARICVKHI